MLSLQGVHTFYGAIEALLTRPLKAE